MTSAVPHTPTRRELLGAGAAGVAGAAGAGTLLALPATAATTTSSISAAPISEADQLTRLISVELLLLYSYRYVLGTSLLGPRTHARLAPFVEHEEAHIDALGTRLKAHGGAMPAGPDSVATANRYLKHRKIGGRLGELKGGPDALRLLLTLEQTTIGTYFVALIHLTDAELIGLVCEIMGSEAQHDAMIALSLPKATLGSAVPYPLVQGLQ